MSGQYRPRDDVCSEAILLQAVKRGITCFDSSDAYGNGHNEELLGRVLAPYKDTVSIVTKFGNVRGPGGQRGGTNGKAEYVPVACDASLGRLGLDVIDVFMLHRVDPEVAIEETVGAMGRLVEAGKVRFIGICEASADTIRRAHATFPLTMVQTEYSLWTRDIEAEILPACRELGIGLMAYAPLGRGFLTAAIKSDGDLVEGDRRRDHPRFAPANVAKNVTLLPVIEEIAAKRGCKPSQVALAWLFTKGTDILPIPGTMTAEHLDANIAASDMRLDQNEMDSLDAVFTPGVTAGTRYPESQMHLMNADSRPL
jgi:aryl-alcohol dehydrogenase-like predicted oxidoreductase